jgi:hypothetical protein
MPLHVQPASTSNADFFLKLAQPGMIGLIAAEGRMLPGLIRRFSGMARFGGTGHPSFWSHAFVVADVVDDLADLEGWRVVVIVESTLVPARHLLRPDWILPGQPDWDGPQWSVLVARDERGRTTGQWPRAPKRRYIDPEFVSNVGLVDTKLDLPSEGPALLADARASLVPERRYAQKELIGFVLKGIGGDLQDPAVFNSDDMFCSAYVRSLLGPRLPALEQGLAGIHESNTTCEQLYRASLGLYDIHAILRNPDNEALSWNKDRERRAAERMEALLAPRPPARAVAPPQATQAAVGGLPPWRRPGMLRAYLETCLQA